eukprot:6441905-Heterocapsa_arctica.AAC.1
MTDNSPSLPAPFLETFSVVHTSSVGCALVAGPPISTFDLMPIVQVFVVPGDRLASRTPPVDYSIVAYSRV